MSLSTIEKPTGEIVDIEEGSLQIAVREGIIQVGKLRVDKGERIAPIEFAKMFGLKIGDRFGE